MSVTEQRLSNRQITTLKQLAICCERGDPTALTRSQREAMQPLWRRGLVEIWYRCIPDEGVARTPFFRPSPSGWNLTRALLAAGDFKHRAA